MDYNVINWFKENNFTVDVGGFRRGFMFVSYVDGQWFISHTFWKSGRFEDGPPTPISYQDRVDWIKYFDRI